MQLSVLVFFAELHWSSIADFGADIAFLSIMLFGPLIWAAIMYFVRTDPIESMVITIPAGLIYLAVFISDYVLPYNGGGASMAYVVAWAYGFALSGVCYFFYMTHGRKKTITGN